MSNNVWAALENIVIILIDKRSQLYWFAIYPDEIGCRRVAKYQEPWAEANNFFLLEQYNNILENSVTRFRAV